MGIWEKYGFFQGIHTLDTILGYLGEKYGFFQGIHTLDTILGYLGEKLWTTTQKKNEFETTFVYSADVGEALSDKN
jgi:hypothetical protein